MSGIAGLVAANTGAIDQAALARMLAAIAHRGQQRQAVLVEERVGFAQATLQTSTRTSLISDLYDGGDIVVTADARLDDRAELADLLGLANPDISDAQLIAAAYLKWGKSCPEYMVGDFAFALWDRHKRQLFCARDHFGVKPFYYTYDAAVFAFGSEIKALRRSGLRDFAIREQAIGEYLAALKAPPGKTFYADILSLLPAHSLTLSDDGIEISEYWSLSLGVPPSTSPTADFIRLFDQAIQRRMQSTASVGALLSGGLDSSSIVCVAAPRYAAEHGQGLPTLSATFDKTPQWSERGFIDSLLAKGNCDPTLLPFDGYAPFANLGALIDEQDEPFFAPGLGMTRGLHEGARDRQLAVLLDGHGGDETVSHGYGRLGDLAKAQQWFTLWREIRGISHLYGEKPLRPFLTFYFSHGPLRPVAIRLHRLKQRLSRKPAGPQPPPAWMEFIREDFADRIDLAQLQENLTPKPPFGAQAQHLADLKSHNIAQGFEILDRQAAAAGIELRYPFWDKDFVEFCLNLPADQKLDGGWTRLILRRSMEGRLPADIQWRQSKLDFAPHVVLGLLEHHADLIDGVIFKDTGQIGGYVNLEALADAYRRMQNLRENTALTDLFGIYRAVVLSEWNRKNL